MKKLAVTAVALLALAAPALAEDWDFILVNNTGKPIKSIDISERGTGKWVANKLDPEMKREGITKVGGRMTVHFDKGSACKYDVKANFADDTNATWSGIDVCDNAFVTINYANGVASFKES